MAEKRMFTQKIIDSDAFLDMPLSTQALYFHLNMRADDDGFVNSPKRIQRTIGASEDDLKLLLAKRFVIGFENGVIVIKHWRMHNTLRKDRYSPTVYQEQLALLDVKDNNTYTEKLQELPKESVATTWQPNGNQDGNHSATQYSIDKYSIEEYREVKESIGEETTASAESVAPAHRSKKEKFGNFSNVLLSEKELQNLNDDFGTDATDKAIAFLDEYIEEKGYKSKSHYLAIRRWVMDAIKEREKKEDKPKTSGNVFLDLYEEWK